MQPFLDATNFSALNAELRSLCHDGIAGLLLSVLAEDGFQVTVSRDPRDLADFQHLHAGHADLPRTPAFDLRYHPEADHNWLSCFLEREGKPIGACAYRLISLMDRTALRALTLQEMLESLRLWYFDPKDAPANERCSADIEVCRNIRQCTICYAGALWIHPDYRGKGLTAIFGKLSRLLTITTKNFDWSYLVLLFKGKILPPLVQAQYGCASWHSGIFHSGQHKWLAVASIKDAIRLVLDSGGDAESEFGFLHNG